MLKKIFFLLLMPVLLCSCTKTSKEVISFASWGSVTEVKIIKKIVANFEKENPDIKVEFIHIPQNYFQKIHLMFASNTPPDVIFINNLNLPLYSDHLEDLSRYVKHEEFYPQALKGLNYKGKLLALPRDISDLVLYVNTDKTKLPNSDWKIENLMERCSVLGKSGDFCISYEDTLYWVSPYLSYFGGGILDNEKNLIIDKRESKSAINFYKNIKTKYHYAPQKSEVGSSTLAQMFLDGRIVFYLSGRWMYPKISEKATFHWAVINFPYGISPQLVDVSGWAVAKASKHKEASIRFIQFLANKESSVYFANTDLIIPARKDSAKILNNNKHNEKVFLEVINNSVNTPVSKSYNKITDKLNQELDL